MKNSFLLIIFLTNTFLNFGQDIKVDKIFPGSPEASSFAEYAKVPVNLYNGLLDLKLPIMTLEGNDMDIDVTLSYHSAGNKVNEISSSVGLGWVLNTGGVITRVVRGKEDEDNDGYFGSNQRGLYINQTPLSVMTDFDIVDYSRSIYDAEPDLYYFNILGKSGNFSMDANGNVIMIPENDFKILPAIGPNSTNSYWTLIDKKGNKYKFGVNNNEVERVKITGSTVYFNQTTNHRVQEHPSSWYLSEIKTNKNRVFQFEYIETPKTEFSTKSEVLTYGGYSISETKTETLNPVHLKKISNENGYISFDISSDRLDLANGTRIKGLSLFNNKLNLIKKVEFNQSYFDSKENCNDPECKRLSLLDVEVSTSDKRLKLYDFEYNSTKLPRRNSPEFDHWGYYNNNGLTNLIPRSNPSDVGMYRTPNEIYTKANILEKIKYPTGGYSKFTFALNSYEKNNLNTVTGGLRIQLIENGGNTQNDLFTTYSYNNENSNVSSGVQFSTPIYEQDRKTYNDAGGGNIVEYNYTEINSFTFNNLYDLNGSNIGYERITKHLSDSSEEIFKYSNLNTNPNTYIQTDYFTLSNQSSTKYLNPFESPYGPPSNENSFQRGLLKEKILKDNQGREVYHLLNNYATLPQSQNRSTLGFKFNLNYQFNQGAFGLYEFYCSRYRIENGNYRLVSSVEKYLYDTGTVSTVNNYTYSFENPTIIKTKEVISSKGSSIVTKYKYPMDFNISGNVYARMVLKNMLDIPIEIINVTDGNKVSAEITTFQETVNGIYPKKKSVLQKLISSNYSGATPDFNGVILHNDYEDQIFYDTFDDRGNLIEYHNKGNVYSTLIWGYAKEYPIAKLENITNAEAENIYQSQLNRSLSSLSDASRYNQESFKNTLNDFKEAIHSQKPNVNITTYSYNPMVGVTSISDTRGNIMSYEYDSFNRLKNTKDLDGNFIEDYKYNYKDLQNINPSPPSDPYFSVGAVPNSYSSPLPPLTSPNSICYTTSIFSKTVGIDTASLGTGSQIIINGQPATASWTAYQWGSSYSSGIRWIRFLANPSIIWDVNPSTGVITGPSSSYNCN